jgi:uncharacterized protein YuzE
VGPAMIDKAKIVLKMKRISGTGLDIVTLKPLPQDKLAKHVLATYRCLRLGMGLITLFFPVILIVVGLSYDVCVQTSYSAYYFGLPESDFEARGFPGTFPTRAFFCGFLFAIGVYMILYKGFTPGEDLLLWIGGVAAICVAIFPMWYEGIYPQIGFAYERRYWIYNIAHYVAAALLFGSMALIAWFCSKTTLRDEQLKKALLQKELMTWADKKTGWSSFLIAYIPLTIPILWLKKILPTQLQTFDRNYNWIGCAMVFYPLVAVVLTHVTNKNAYFVLVFEAFAIETFAAFWLLKTRELSLSKPEEQAIKGMTTLAASFASLASELSSGLRAAGRASLADQVDAAAIARVTFDGSTNAGYIYLQPSRDSNVVETNVVGVRHGETLEVATRYSTKIDIDNFGRLAGIKILAPGDLKSVLRKYADG